MFLVSDKQRVLTIFFKQRCYDESVHNFVSKYFFFFCAERQRNFEDLILAETILKFAHMFQICTEKSFFVKKITLHYNIILEGLSYDQFCNSVFLFIYRICCWKLSIDVEYLNTVQYPYCTEIFANMQHEVQFSVSNVWDATDIIQLPGGVLGQRASMGE